MSVVEKAAEKLKTLQSDSSALPRIEPAMPQAAPTVERLQERMRTPGDAAQPVSPWRVDETALKRYGFLPVDNEAAGRLTDELRRVKRPLLDNLSGKSTKALAHGQRIVVTSAVPGEGKTFTAVNLALSLAREPDFEVLLVDGDIPKSDITRVLGLEGRPGLMEVLADEGRHTSEVIVQTDVPNLLVVPAGERHPLTAELFGGRRMEYVLGELGDRNRRRLVVFDSSPLLAVSESQVLVSHMGQVVMVVAAGRSRQQEVRAAMQSLNDSQYVGLILNMSRLPASESHYSSHYGYYSRGR
jgi:exopolysaccharide/PEP-CTERM locus tyrosine autokinase